LASSISAIFRYFGVNGIAVKRTCGIACTLSPLVASYLLRNMIRLSIFISLAANLGAQSDRRPNFEEAVIKPAGPESRIGFRSTPGRLAASEITLWRAVYIAYNLTPTEMSGGPSWIDKDEFDITASLNETQVASTVPEQRKQNLEALQSLLEDRFQLKFHHEARTQPILVMTVAKAGFKLKDGEKLPAGTPLGYGNATTSRMTRASVPISDLSYSLSGILHYHVEDRTELAGKYSFVLEYSKVQPAADPTSPTATVPVDPIEAVTTALHEQLGLDLRRSQGPVDIFVIDSAQKPGAN
jgi:uncharacterized protein (TIGR03435 family)